jgi:hypothetical protein
MGRLQSKGHSKLDIDHTALNSASLSIHSHSISHFLSNLGPKQMDTWESIQYPTNRVVRSRLGIDTG